MTTEGSPGTPPGDEPREKLKYERPVLLVYGDIREVTKSVGRMGALDGGMAGMNKSQ